MYHTRELIVLSVCLGLACLASAQSQSCPLITINDLGSTTEFSTNGLVAQGIIPPGDTSSQSIFVRIVDFNIVCNASGDRIDTSSYVSVIVQLQCNSTNVHSTLADCNGSTMITRQYQFQCIEDNGQPAWDAIVSGSNMNVQTLTPTATFSTPLANQCRRCIDDQQSSRADPITHCDRESSMIVCSSCYYDYHTHEQHVHHNVTRDKGVAILGLVLMNVVTFTLKISVQQRALVLW